jgi:hypothetical protein
VNHLAQSVPAIIWIALLGYVLGRHVTVYRLYDKQLHLVQQIEAEGGIETGSTLVAVNQRVRYLIRILLSVFGILIGIGGIYGVYNQGFGQSVAFGVSVLAYFYLSEAATGYLTIRDKRVIDRLLEIDDERLAAANKEEPDAEDA